MQDPEPYLQNQGITVACAVHGDRPAVIDAAHRSSVNFEVFYFSDEASKAGFDANPPRYCGALTDPVTHARFVPGTASPRIDWEGRPYYFLSEETLAQFKAMPDSFAKPNYTMRPMPAMPEDPATSPPMPAPDAAKG